MLGEYREEWHEKDGGSNIMGFSWVQGKRGRIISCRYWKWLKVGIILI